MKTIEEAFIEQVRAKIESRRYGSQIEIARKMGLERGTFNNKLKGRRGTTESFRRDLAKILDIDYEKLASSTQTHDSSPPMYGDTTISPEPSNVTPYFDPRPIIRVPVISWVQAGGWEHAADPFPPGDADDWLETSATSNKHAFALAVHGDSMAPEFSEGDLIVVDPDRRAENGSYIIAKNGADEATFKKLVIDGSSVFLQPLNDRYPIRDMTGVEFKIIGVVSEKRKRY